MTDLLSRLFALFPLLSVIFFPLAVKNRLKAGIILSVGFFAFSILLGQTIGLLNIGILYALLFLVIGFFPVPLHREIERAIKEHQVQKRPLEEKLAKRKLLLDDGLRSQTILLEEMEQILKRYSFAKSLVSHIEEKPILEELGSIFSSEKKVQGIAFFKTPHAPQDHPLFQQAHETENRHSWNPSFTTGWINQEEWKKILEKVPPPPDSIHSVPLNSFPKFYELLYRKIKLKEKNESLFLVTASVQWGGKVDGILTFLVSGSPSKEFLGELSIYTQLLGLGLHKTALYRLTRERSRRDGLTNLYLRHIFLERLNTEINFSKRYGASFSLLLLDLDHFKSVNDTYGHTAGDQVLKNVADCLCSILHPGVTICRYGGEEFGILIGLAPPHEVLEVAERIRTNIANIETRISEKTIIKKTVSIGVAHYFPDAPTTEEIIRRADISLYQAKKAGRNCVREWKKER